MTPYEIDLEVENTLRGITELQADELISSIKELQEDKQRFEAIAKGKIENIQSTLEIQTIHIDNEVQFMKDQLRAFFNTVKAKETKTQKSYSLLSGKLIYKKASQKIKHDDVKILEWAEEYAVDFIDIKEVKRFQWAEFKRELVISNGMITNKTTGEVLEGIDGLTLEEVKESFDIK